MTVNEVRERIIKGECLSNMFEFTDGQECMIYKGEWNPGDDVIYIPDIDLNEICINRPLINILNKEEIENVLFDLYTGKDFMELADGDEKFAKRLFYYCDWQHPSSALNEVIDDEEDKKEEEQDELKELKTYIKQLEDENKRLKDSNKSLRTNNKGLLDGQKKLEKKLHEVMNMKLNYAKLCVDNAIEITWIYDELVKAGKIYSVADVGSDLVKELIIEYSIEFENEYGDSDWNEIDYFDCLRKYVEPRLIHDITFLTQE